MHTGKYNHLKGTQLGKSVAIRAGEWHTYTINWSPDDISFAVDGQTYLHVVNDGEGIESWPFDKRFHLILNLAVGGNLGGRRGLDVDAMRDGQTMQVEWVRVYQKPQRASAGAA